MLNTQITAERIKSQAKSKGISVKKLLENCELGVNTITKMSNGNDIVSQNLLKIAEFLDCSVDYLLGRTETPELNNGNGINIGDNSVNNNTNVNISTASVSEIEEFAEMMKGLSLVQRSKVVVMIDEMKKEN